MHEFFARVAAATCLSIGLATGQTPPNTNPSTSQTLNAHYELVEVTPNALLPQSLVSTQPDISLNQTISGTYMVMLVDLAIPQSSIKTTGPEAPGIISCRTTRLHWFQGNLTQSSNGSFIGRSAPTADYGGPMPGLNDVPHTYTLYLFKQPSNFTLPAWDAGRDYNPISSYERMNFSVTAIADQVGSPIAANYIRVQNRKNNATGTFVNGTCPSSVTGSSNASSTGTSPQPTLSVTPYTGAASAFADYRSPALVTILGSLVLALL